MIRRAWGVALAVLFMSVCAPVAPLGQTGKTLTGPSLTPLPPPPSSTATDTWRKDKRGLEFSPGSLPTTPGKSTTQVGTTQVGIPKGVESGHLPAPGTSYWAMRTCEATGLKAANCQKALQGCAGTQGSAEEACVKRAVENALENSCENWKGHSAANCTTAVLACERKGTLTNICVESRASQLASCEKSGQVNCTVLLGH